MLTFFIASHDVDSHRDVDSRCLRQVFIWFIHDWFKRTKPQFLVKSTPTLIWDNRIVLDKNVIPILSICSIGCLDFTLFLLQLAFFRVGWELDSWSFANTLWSNIVEHNHWFANPDVFDIFYIFSNIKSISAMVLLFFFLLTLCYLWFVSQKMHK